MKSLHVKKGDKVIVIAGKDKGATGEVIAVNIETQRVTVQGVNIVKKHRKDQVDAEGKQVKGGVVNVEAPIHVSNVQPVVKVDGKEVGSRVGYRREDVTRTRADGTTVTVSKSVRYLKKEDKDQAKKPASASSTRATKKAADKKEADK